MAKFYNNRVKSGRLAGSVFAIRNGETIERAYQPVVANPKSPAQVASRAKLKLMSQLSAVMAPVIAIPRQGSVSSRNLFTKKNYGATSYNSNEASIDLLAVQLTSSVVSLPDLTVTRTSGNVLVSLNAIQSSDLNRVVYAVFEKQEDETLRFLTSSVVSEPGADNNFPTTITLDSASITAVIYAYGVRDNSMAARVVFGNLQVPTAQTVAKLIVSRALTGADITVTETKARISAPSRELDPEPERKTNKK